MNNAADLSGSGVSYDSMPTTGLLSRSPDFVTAEGRARMQDRSPFMTRDQNVKTAAADKVASVMNPTADQNAVGPAVTANEKALSAARDAEALPLLKQAETSGAVVNAQPVADLIDQMIGTTKRDPVINALTAVRKKLAPIQSDPTNPNALDTSVAGLYETRKAVNDIIAGRGVSPTDKYAQKELIQVRDALDVAITGVAPQFGEYLAKYRAGSEPLDAFKSPTADVLTNPNNDVRDMAANLFSGYGGQKRLAEIKNLIGSNPAANEGFKSAVAEVLVKRITNTKEVGANYEVSYANLAKEFKNHEVLLSQVFDPPEMRNLRQGHKLLEYFKEAEKRAGVGSNTVETGGSLLDSKAGKVYQLMLRHVYGTLEGGGMVARMRTALSLMPQNTQTIENIANLAFFDPQVAAYLLGKKVRSFESIGPNAYLKRAIAAAQSGNAPGNSTPPEITVNNGTYQEPPK
jgi:hypothetical protein